MTIKQQGGIFGRNPTFNDLTVEGSVSLPSGSVSGDSIDGGSTVTNASAEALKFNRTGTNGDIVEFLKDNSSVGTIGSEGGDALYIQSGTTSGTGLLFSSNNTAIRAARNGVTVDATLDLGSITRRFRNLHLSGDVIVASGQGIDFSATSGTGTSELFDDYEEGTWTPVLSDATSGGNTATLGSSTAHYVKVGSVVHLFLQVINVNNSGMTGGNTLYIQGLPYTSVSTNNSAGSAVFDRVSVSGFFAVTPAIGPTRDYMTLGTTTTGAADGNLTVAAFNNSSSDIQNLHISYRA